MITKITLALFVTLALYGVPGAVAHQSNHHARVSHSRGTDVYGNAYAYGSSYPLSQSRGYAPVVPDYTPYRGWRCVTDEGQGRFLPCEMGGG